MCVTLVYLIVSVNALERLKVGCVNSEAEAPLIATWLGRIHSNVSH